jgi:nicotinamidase-related amidase
LLCIINAKRDYITCELGSKYALTVMQRINSKIVEYLKNGGSIIFTKDTHFDNYLETQEGKYFRTKHTVKGTEGWEIQPDLLVATWAEEEDIPLGVIEATAFGSFELAEHINTQQPSLVEFCGFDSATSVISNALIVKSRCPEIPIYVDYKCCSSGSKEMHDAAMLVLEGCQIHVVNSEV